MLATAMTVMYVVVGRSSGCPALRQRRALRNSDAGLGRFQRLVRLGTRPRDVLSGLTRRGLQQLFPVSRKHPEIGPKLAVARSYSALGHSFSSIHAH
jgi:hypothetical protein